MELVIYVSKPTPNSGIVEYIGASFAYGAQVAESAKKRHKRQKRDCRVLRVDKQLREYDYRKVQRAAHTKIIWLARQ